MHAISRERPLPLLAQVAPSALRMKLTQCLAVQLFTFVIGQCFVTMLCSMKWGVFIFFAAMVVIMTAWVILLIPGGLRLHTAENGMAGIASALFAGILQTLQRARAHAPGHDLHLLITAIPVGST